jgi:TIGR03009 family protein
MPHSIFSSIFYNSKLVSTHKKLAVGFAVVVAITIPATAFGIQAQAQAQNPSAAARQQPRPQQQAPIQQAQQDAFNAQNRIAQENLRAADAAAMQQPQRPFPELPPEETQYLHQFLEYWQSSSTAVKQYACEFKRYEYDSEAVNYRDPTTNRLAAARIATGSIKYAEPDKGFYETNNIWDFSAPPKNPGEEAAYKKLESDVSKERWICDGRSIYEFDFASKTLYDAEIPPNMQGERIIDSPLPFLFGAKKDHILERYWVRVVPQNAEDEYWLEAYPKRIEDARLYSKIEVILAKEDFLPKAMHVYSPQYDPAKGNFQSRYFAFENRKVNDRLHAFKDFMNIFVRPQTPILGGWKRTTRQPMHDQQAELPGLETK